MLGNRDGIYPEDTDYELIHKISPPPAVFVTGHTHRPLIRRANGTLIVNAGSVGLPFDGDTRAAYAQIIHHKGQWLAKIIRLKYNLQLAEKDFLDFGFFEGGGPLRRNYPFRASYCLRAAISMGFEILSPNQEW